MAGNKKNPQGRPALPKDPLDPILTYSVRIPASQAALLKEWGGGNISAGLRWLMGAVEGHVKRRLSPPGTSPPAPP